MAFRNRKQEVKRVAELLNLHRNTVTNKMQEWHLTATNFTEAQEVNELIIQSKTLRKTGRTVMRMRDAENKSKFANV